MPVLIRKFWSGDRRRRRFTGYRGSTGTMELVAIKMAVESYRQKKTLLWDAQAQKDRVMRTALSIAALLVVCACCQYGNADPAGKDLTEAERRNGWLLLFDGKTHAGWMNSDSTSPRTPVIDGALNPHRAGHYMLVHTQQWENFILSLDFKISPKCNSGIFVRTSSLTPRAGKDVGFNGIEIAIDDTTNAGFTDTAAVYDLGKPTRNAMRPAGEWNHIEITCRGTVIEVVLNGAKVNSVDLAKFVEPHKRPDGTAHKFDVAYRDHPRRGYIGLQDHGSPCWFKNIKLKPLD